MSWPSVDLDRCGRALPQILEAARRCGCCPAKEATPRRSQRPPHARADVVRAWMPWIILSVLVFCWGLPQVKAGARRDLGGAHPRSWSPQPDRARSARRRVAHGRSRRSSSSTGFRPPAAASSSPPSSPDWSCGYSPLELAARLLAHDQARSFLTDHDCRDDLARLHDALLGRRCDARSGIRADRAGSIRSSGRCSGWLGVALTGSDTSSNVSVRQPAANHRRATRSQSRRSWRPPTAPAA